MALTKKSEALSLEERVAAIIRQAEAYLPNQNVSKEIRRAYEFSKQAHEGQKRLSGEEYITHPLAVTELLMEYRPDLHSIQTALLHDVYEDTKTPLPEVERAFGKDVANLVQSMTKLGTIKYRGEERTIENLRKMFLAISKDIRILFIKFCDRLHNMQTLHFHEKEEKRRRIALETLNIYAPIAARLNMYRMRDALQEYCFKHLYPEEYKDIMAQLDKRSKQRQKSIAYAQAELMNLLKEYGIEARITGRVKSPYTIFTKIRDKQRDSIDDIYDIFALRIIVTDIPTCYAVLGIIHQKYSPLSHRFKDYIGMPKPNGYQSIHTGVIGLGRGIRNLPTEIQIRTEVMDQIAEYGIAAHTAYKERDVGKVGYNAEVISENEAALLKNLARIGKERGGREEFWAELQRELFRESIFIFTPKGDVKELPMSSTPLDFAYSVHTDIGNRCKAAKVNGSIVQLNYELQSGDVVEIITQKDTHPSQYWLSLVKTSSARSKIKAYLLQQNRDQLIKTGRMLLNQQLSRLGESELDQELSVLKNYDDRTLDPEERETILVNIGNGSVTASSVLKKALQLARPAHQPIAREGKKKEGTDRVLISGERDLPYRLAACCHPMKGSRIIGFVTRGGGISVHATSCKTVKGLDPQRFISAKWQGEEKKITHNPILRLNVIVTDKVGALRDLLEVFYRMRMSIVSIRSKGVEYGNYLNIIDTECTTSEPLENLDQLISNLEVLDFVKSVEGRVIL